MARKTALKIAVKPKPGSSPQVRLDDRSPHANGRKKLQWVKDVGAEKFDFIAFAPDTAPHKNPFKNIDVKKHRIKCDFQPAAEEIEADPDIEYQYTVTIEFNEVPLNSDEDEDPDSGRAVIRN